MAYLLSQQCMGLNLYGINACVFHQAQDWEKNDIANRNKNTINKLTYGYIMNLNETFGTYDKVFSLLYFNLIAYLYYPIIFYKML